MAPTGSTPPTPRTQRGQERPAGAVDGRFDRQVRFAPLGPDGQARLGSARVLLVGCGALGGVLAQTLTRAGVGELVLLDRDVVELSNLPRQVLFDERHAREGTPKAQAARETLERVGGPTQLQAEVAHLDARNIATLAAGCDLVLDGTDNLPTRYLLNDYCVASSLPWVYAGVVGGSGLVLAVVPGKGACLRCVFPDPPQAGTLPTCDTAGVILPAVGSVASMAAGQALRLLARPEERDAHESALLELDAWNGTVRRLRAPRDPECPACGKRSFPFLHRPDGREPVLLCGRNTVQLPAPAGGLDLEALATRLAGEDVVRTPVLLRLGVEDLCLTLFRDGRALVEGTEDVGRARALVDRIVGT